MTQIKDSRDRIRQLYLNSDQKGSSRALKPFYDILWEEGKISKHLSFAKFKTYFETWPPM